MDEKLLLRLMDATYETGYYAATMEKVTLTRTEYDHYSNLHLRAIDLRNRLKRQLLAEGNNDSTTG